MPRTGSMGSNVGPAADQHALARQRLGAKEADQFFEQLFGLEHAPVADLATRLLTTRGAEDVRAIGAQLRCVALGGRMGPHLAVHRRSDQQRTSFDRPSQAEKTQQIVGAAVQQLRHEVGTGRSHQHRIGPPRQVDVRHVVRDAVDRTGIPGAREHRFARQGLHRHGGDELLGRLGHDNLHRGTRLHQRARQFGGLVAGDAARQAQHDVLPVEVTCSIGRIGHDGCLSSIRAASRPARVHRN